MRLAGLISYEREREPLILNTEHFLAGLPAHHALLYGPPGTGKSSTVKAVLNEYADRGFRLVEVKKEDLGELPRVLEVLRGRGPRFVLFVDDLSFEEHEVEYKALKALLEGSVEEPPENVRVYATSNRRNLIRETFSDREEVRRRSRPRHHAREALPRSPLRPAPDLPLPRPEALPPDSSRPRQRTGASKSPRKTCENGPSSGTAGTPAAPAAPPDNSSTNSRRHLFSRQLQPVSISALLPIVSRLTIQVGALRMTQVPTGGATNA